MKRYRQYALHAAACLLWTLALPVRGSNPVPAKPHKTLIVFFDGLRSDYITPEAMPHLYAFTRQAGRSTRHHSVFPTVTRVNSASYATGAYPGSHGLLGNTVYFPLVDNTKGLNTSVGELRRISEAHSGRLLTAVSLGEALRSAGEQMYVFSSGTTGQAFLQNHTVNGAVINPDVILPETLKPAVIRAVGDIPADKGYPKTERHTWITDAFLHYGLPDDGPLVSAIWFSDPDGSAHAHGIGSPQARQAITHVDAQFGRILEALTQKGLTGSVNIIVSTDHGFVTQKGKESLPDFLNRKGLSSGNVVVAERAIYVRDQDPALIRKIVEALHQEEWVGAIFTKAASPGNMQGWIKGTLSFDAVHWNHPERSADILVAPDWDDRKNENGYSGTDQSTGVAGHGGSSPYEILINLFTSGPDFKKDTDGALPTSNIDIAPTLLAIYGIEAPSTMNGRVLSELLSAKPGKKYKSAKNQVIETNASYAWGTYSLQLDQSVLGSYRYVNFTKVTRTPRK